MTPSKKTGYEVGTDYPHVKPEFFTAHALVNIDTGEIRQDGFDGFRLHADKSSIILPGTDIILPGHKLTLGQDESILLEDRFAIIGYGSNCSPEILKNKFAEKGIGGTFIIAQSSMIDHAVCHGAFMGGKGTVPATVLPYAGSNAHITVGFFTAEQARVLTDSEPNYDLVAFETAVKILGTDERNVIPEKTMAYTAIWGALTSPTNSNEPLALKAIPQETTLSRFSSQQAMDRVAELIGHSSTESLFNAVADGMPLKDRLAHNWDISTKAGLPANITGIRVKGSTIATDCERFGLAVPQIAYNR